jgi:sec-independent protein translocase protein TatC
LSMSAPCTSDSDRAEDELDRMTLVEHLTELRKRLVISMLSVVIGTVIGIFLYDAVIHFIAHPYQDFAHRHPSQVVANGQLVVTGPLEGFSTRLKVSAYLGIFFASPILLWELWRLSPPGCTPMSGATPSASCRLPWRCSAWGSQGRSWCGPKPSTFLIRIGGSNVAALYGPSKYVTLYVAAAAIFGVVFLFPVVLVFLEVVGIVPSAQLRKVRRPAIVGIAFLATVATPSSDPYSFIAMAVPLYLFYEMAIVIGRILKK